MAKKEAARRCGNSTRARGVHIRQDTDIVAQERAYRILGWIVGIAFGVMFAMGIIGG